MFASLCSADSFTRTVHLVSLSDDHSTVKACSKTHTISQIGCSFDQIYTDVITSCNMTWRSLGNQGSKTAAQKDLRAMTPWNITLKSNH